MTPPTPRERRPRRPRRRRHPGRGEVRRPRQPAKTEAAPRRKGRWSEAMRFFGSFLRQPASIGSLVPSSRFLARAMLDRAGLESARTVVELGPGTGAITAPLLQRVSSKTLVFALEVNEGHVRSLRARFPTLQVFMDSAENLRRHLSRFRVRRADTIVSALPWTNMPSDLQQRILDSILDSIAPNGTLVTFTYAPVRWLPGARRFHRLLNRHFSDVQISRVVWRNVPPAVIYCCRRPWRSAQLTPDGPI